MLRIGRTLTALALAAVLAACGSSTQAVPAPGPGAAPASAIASGCPLGVNALDAATSLTWELSDTRTDQPLETVDAVAQTVCLFTAADSPQSGGDPLVLRVDVVTGADAATVRNAFTSSCTGNSGTVSSSAGAPGAMVCMRAGAVVEGDISSGDRTVDVYLVNADAATAAALTPRFDDILAAVR